MVAKATINATITLIIVNIASFFDPKFYTKARALNVNGVFLHHCRVL
jgi:hypothetical protein